MVKKLGRETRNKMRHLEGNALIVAGMIVP